MDAEQTIAEIERLERIFTEPETRPLRRWITQEDTGLTNLGRKVVDGHL
jgi:hypothetical protein